MKTYWITACLGLLTITGWAQGQDNEIEEITVTARPLSREAMEMTQATAVLHGESLQSALENTIGETIEGIPGVQSANFGAGVGRPIIRGLDGARVAVLENNVASNDVSGLSADHAVTVEPFLAEQVEVLRGPATLLYGTNGIGGVVNVRTNRVPSRLTDGVETGFQAQADTVSDSIYGGVHFDYGSGALGLHADAFMRDREDYEIPGFAELGSNDPDGARGRLENSFVDTEGGAVGVSALLESGYVGISYSRYENRYGIPGAGHHGEEEGEEEEAAVTLDIKQDKVDAAAELGDPLPGWSRMRMMVSRNDYTHTEFEGEETGTVFETTTLDGRIELTHDLFYGWNGVVGMQFYDRDFGAFGEEAFVPPSQSERLGLFVLEERRFGDWLLELGARVDDVDVQTDSGLRRSFSPVSTSAGVIWHFSETSHLALGLSRSARAPVTEELFADGPHVATQSFEIGDPDLGEETATNLEVSVHRHDGRWTGSLTAYRNAFDDFVYLAEEGGVEDGLPIRRWRQQDADFTGVEAEIQYELNENWTVNALADTIDARLDNGSNLPRTPPRRLGAGLEWARGAWAAGLKVLRYADQDDTAPGESATDGYTLVDADLSYEFGTDGRWRLYLRGRNLGDNEARNHTSLLKDTAPLPGRNFILGIRARF